MTGSDSGLPHVVHMIDELPPDGAERLIADIIAHRTGRFRYSVVCLVAGGKLAAEIEGSGVPVTVLGRRPGIDLGTLPALRRWLKAHRPQVVHTHLFAADTYGRVAALLARVPVIVSTRHNTRAWQGRGRRALARVLAVATSRTIACGREVGRTMVESERIPARKMVVIPNGIDLRRFAAADRMSLRSELGVPEGRILLGVVGRLHAQKGHLDLLEALAALPGGITGWTCVIAGSGPLEGAIKDRILELGLQDRVRLIGQRDDMPDVLAALDVFVMPSRWEGLPMALLEAMTFRLPIVATRVGSIPDVIDENRNGILVPPADPPALSAALHRLVTEPASRERLGREARESVERVYNAELTAKAYEDLYRELLAG